LTLSSRLEKEVGQNDFLEVVADKTRKGEITVAEMEAHSWNMAYVMNRTLFLISSILLKLDLAWPAPKPAGLL